MLDDFNQVCELFSEEWKNLSSLLDIIKYQVVVVGRSWTANIAPLQKLLIDPVIIISCPIESSLKHNIHIVSYRKLLQFLFLILFSCFNHAKGSYTYVYIYQETIEALSYPSSVCFYFYWSHWFTCKTCTGMGQYTHTCTYIAFIKYIGMWYSVTMKRKGWGGGGVVLFFIYFFPPFSRPPSLSRFCF